MMANSNRFLSAFWKFLLVVVVVHVLILIIANFASGTVGLFGLKVFWAHISGGIATMSIALVLAILLYYIIYQYWTK